MTAESAFSFTTKINGDLLTVRGSTVQEFTENLTAAGSAVAAVVALQQQAQAEAGATGVARAQQSLGATVIADPSQNACEHGPRVWKEGTGKQTGKPYRGYFCPANDRSCKPVFS